ncbi:hypothetical protein ACT7DH_10595 [Bacillus pacificus]
MKPIFDYGPAIEYLKWATYHQIDDSPFKYSTGQELRMRIEVTCRPNYYAVKR